MTTPVVPPLKQVLIRSFTEFVQEAENDDDWLASLVLFRGQAVKGNLLPSVARSKPHRDSTEVERKALEQLRFLGASLLPPGETSPLDLLVLAQHFGLKTRLLDWTTNPLAALWFACSDRSEGDAYVYVLEAASLEESDSLVESDVYSKDPFAPWKTRVIQPRHNNARIVAQDGWFTLHRYSKTAKAFVPLEKNPGTAKRMRELRVPSNARMSMLRSLERNGVTSRTVYPDLGGLCQFLNRKFVDV